MDPLTLAAVFAGAQAAVKGVKQAIALGKEARDVYNELRTFFHAQGEIEVAFQINHNAVALPDEDKRSATQKALDLVFMRREMYKMEVELRETLIYQFNESGLYDEMCVERARIVEAEQDAIREAREAKRLADRKIAKKKQDMKDAIINSLAILIGSVAAITIICGIIWMFQQGGTR